MLGSLSKRLARVEELAGTGQPRRTWVVWAEPGTPLAKAIRDSGIDYRPSDHVMVLNWQPGELVQEPMLIPDFAAMLRGIDGQSRGLPN